MERVAAKSGESWTEIDISGDDDLEDEYGLPHPGRAARRQGARLLAGRGGAVAAGPRSRSVSRHLVWDWNGTLLNDLDLCVTATNACLATIGGPRITAEDHRRDFRRPIVDYYSFVLGRPVDAEEFRRLDDAFHDAYRLGMADLHAHRRRARGDGDLGRHPSRCCPCSSTTSCWSRWPGTGWRTNCRVWTDCRTSSAGNVRRPTCAAHLSALDIPAADVVLIGDSVDDGDAAAAVGAACVLYAGGFTHESHALRDRPAGRLVARRSRPPGGQGLGSVSKWGPGCGGLSRRLEPPRSRPDTTPVSGRARRGPSRHLSLASLQPPL